MGPSGFQLLADDGSAVAPLIRLDEGRAHIPIAVFRDAIPMVGAPGGIFSNIHTHPGDQLSRVGKARDVADFRDHREGKGLFAPFVTDQSLHWFLIAWHGGQLLDLLVIARQDGGQAFEVLQEEFQVHVQTPGSGGDGPLQPARVMEGPIGAALSLRLVMKSIAAQQGLQMLAQGRLLLDQMLARAQQIPVLFLCRLGDTDHREQAIGIELRELCRINAISFDLFAPGGGDTRRGHHITVIPLFGSIPLQGITKIGRFITQPERASRKMLAEFLQLAEQALQRWPTVEINNDTSVVGKGRTMILGIIDIKAHVDE